MSKIMVLGFGDEAAADAFKDDLQALVDDGVLQVEDAVKVTVAQDGTPKYDHDFSVTRGGAVVGGILGGVVGLLFLNPVAGAVIGAAGGAAVGKLTGDYGLEEEFIAQTSETLKPGTTALFVQAKRVDRPDALEAALENAGASVITTRLNREAEELLEAKLAEERPGD